MEKKLLIIEDERSAAHALELKMSFHGFVSTWCANGKEAIDTLKNDKFHLILCDLMMPVSDGFEVLRFMQRNAIHTPIVVTSNLAQPEDKEKAGRLGAIAYYVKSDMSLDSIAEEAAKFSAK